MTQSEFDVATILAMMNKEELEELQELPPVEDPDDYPDIQLVSRYTANEKSAVDFVTKHGMMEFPQCCDWCGSKAKTWGRVSVPGSKYYFMRRCGVKSQHHNGKQWAKSAKSGTLFQYSKLAIGSFIYFVYFWLLGIPYTAISRIVGINPNTVTDWATYLREVVVAHLAMTQENGMQQPLGGPGIIVKIDESKFGKRKYHVSDEPHTVTLAHTITPSQRGHRVEGCWVFGGIERIWDEDNNRWRAGRMFAEVVAKRDKATLIPILKKRVAPGSIIHSDFRAYDCIPELEGYNFEHKKVNHSKGFKASDGTHTNTIEGAWYSKFKRHIPNNAYNQHALQDYLFVQMWKEIHKDNLWGGFWTMVDGLRVDDDEGIYWVHEKLESDDETEIESESEQSQCSP